MADHPYEPGVFKIGKGTTLRGSSNHRIVDANTHEPFRTRKVLHMEFVDDHRGVELRAHSALEQFRVYKNGRATEWFRTSAERVIRAVEDAALWLEEALHGGHPASC